MTEKLSSQPTATLSRRTLLQRACFAGAWVALSSLAAEAQTPQAGLTPAQQGIDASHEFNNPNWKPLFFTDEQNQGDTAESYQSKKQRVQQEARDRQRRTYERGEEQKKGKVLDSLAGVDDDDPISGMP